MKRRPVASLISLAILALAQPVLAQDEVSDINKYCWGENIGYINWRDAGNPAGSQGARLHNSFLSGFAWSENTGWINLGDGTPANGVSYANAEGSDAGVNYNPDTGRLTGLAWGENIGWINFTGPVLAPASQRARISLTAPHRLLGYAWGENVGWLNLDDASVFVEFAGACPADWNGDGNIDSSDISAFISSWLASIASGTLDADFDGDGVVNSSDISAFLTAWLAAVGGWCG